MRKEDISEEQYVKIMERFIHSLVKNGLKATTMDSVASSLQMSKRTLYEIFGTKDELFRQAHEFFHKKLLENLTSLFKESANVMEAIIKCILYNRDLMSHLSADFVRDIQEYSKSIHKTDKDSGRHHYQNLYAVLLRGVKEGYFRDDVNLMVQCRLLMLQMEAVKHTEDHFPHDISPIEVYDSISLSFLRGISSEKGLKELEKFLPLFSNFKYSAQLFENE